MKTLNNILLCTLILSFTLSACKKDEPIKTGGGGGSNPPNGGNTNNCLLQKEIHYLESDTTNKANSIYHYNNRDLVTKIVLHSGNLAHDSILFQYDNKDRLSYVFEHSYFQNAMDTSEQHLYDMEGRLIQINQFHSDTLNAIFQFTYSQNSALPSIFLADYKHSSSEKYQLNWLNGNLVQAQVIEIGGSPTNPKPTYTFTYDQQDNPYKGLYNDDLLLWEMFSKNNVTNFTLQEGNNNYSETNTLSYKNSKLVKIRSEMQGQPVEVTEFEYSCN